MAYPVCTPDATDVTTPAESDSIFCIQAEIRAIKEYMQTATNAQVPPGVYSNFAGAIAPPGWIFANQEVSRTTYANLFAVLGTSYGEGDGSTTFNLPSIFNTAGDAAIVTYTDLPVALANHTITELQDGRLIVIGGTNVAAAWQDSVYIGTISGTGDTQTITWQTATALPIALAFHGVFTMDGNSILVCGGSGAADNDVILAYKGVITGATITWTSHAIGYTFGKYANYVQISPTKGLVFGDTVGRVVSINLTTLLGAVVVGELPVARKAGICKLTTNRYIRVGGTTGSSPYPKILPIYAIDVTDSLSSFTYSIIGALPAGLINVNLFALSDSMLLAIGEGADELPIAYLGTITAIGGIYWEICTAWLSSFIGTAYWFVVPMTRLNNGKLLRAGGLITGGAIADILSWIPSNVIIKT